MFDCTYIIIQMQISNISYILIHPLWRPKKLYINSPILRQLCEIHCSIFAYNYIYSLLVTLNGSSVPLLIISMHAKNYGINPICANH